MMLYLDVFRSAMEYGHCYCWHIVTKHCSWFFLLMLKIDQYPSKPNCLASCACNSASTHDNIIVACFLDDHEITLDPIWNFQRLGWKHRWPKKHKFQLGSKVIKWSYKKLATIALSSAEAEYIVATSAACKAVWLRRILIDLQHKQDEPTIMFCDNMSTMAMTKNSVFHNRSKHIEIRCHYICELVDKKEIEL